MKARVPEHGSLRQLARVAYRESRELSREIQAQERHGAAAAGLTAVGAQALRIIGEACGRLTMLELARELCIRRSTTTRLVDDLEAKGYLRRATSSADRRQTLLELRPAGAARLASHLDSAEQMQMEILLRLSPVQRKACLEGLALWRKANQQWNTDHLPEG